jgi:hypothetical protein
MMFSREQKLHRVPRSTATLLNPANIVNWLAFPQTCSSSLLWCIIDDAPGAPYPNLLHDWPFYVWGSLAPNLINFKLHETGWRLFVTNIGRPAYKQAGLPTVVQAPPN